MTEHHDRDQRRQLPPQVHSREAEVTARLKMNATLIASVMSVIIPGSRSSISRQAPWMKTQPPYANTSAPNTAGTQRDATGRQARNNRTSAESSGAHTNVGIESRSVPQNFCRNISTECPAWRSWLAWLS